MRHHRAVPAGRGRQQQRGRRRRGQRGERAPPRRAGEGARAPPGRQRRQRRAREEQDGDGERGRGEGQRQREQRPERGVGGTGASRDRPAPSRRRARRRGTRACPGTGAAPPRTPSRGPIGATASDEAPPSTRASVAGPATAAVVSSAVVARSPTGSTSARRVPVRPSAEPPGRVRCQRSRCQRQVSRWSASSGCSWDRGTTAVRRAARRARQIQVGAQQGRDHLPRGAQARARLLGGQTRATPGRARQQELGGDERGGPAAPRR